MGGWGEQFLDFLLLLPSAIIPALQSSAPAPESLPGPWAPHQQTSTTHLPAAVSPLRPLERILSTGVRVTVTMCHSWPFPARDPPSGSLLGCKVRLPLSAEACRVLGRPAPPGCASSFPLCTAQAASSSHPRALGSSSAHTEALPGASFLSLSSAAHAC